MRSEKHERRHGEGRKHRPRKEKEGRLKGDCMKWGRSINGKGRLKKNQIHFPLY